MSTLPRSFAKWVKPGEKIAKFGLTRCIGSDMKAFSLYFVWVFWGGSLESPSWKGKSYEHIA